MVACTDTRPAPPSVATNGAADDAADHIMIHTKSGCPEDAHAPKNDFDKPVACYFCEPWLATLQEWIWMDYAPYPAGQVLVHTLPYRDFPDTYTDLR